MTKIKIDDISHEHSDTQLLEELPISEQQLISGGAQIRFKGTLTPTTVNFTPPSVNRTPGGNFLTAINC